MADYMSSANIGNLDDIMTEKLSGMADQAQLDLLHLANVVSSATSMETGDFGTDLLQNMTVNTQDSNGFTTTTVKHSDGLDAGKKAKLDKAAQDNGYKDWNAMADDFNKFGMGRSLGGLTAGSPIQIQAIQSDIQTVVDASTALAKAKETLNKKIAQNIVAINQ